MLPLLELKGSRPLVSGAYRDVFQHPLEDHHLVKVIKPLFVERQARRARRYDYLRGIGAYKGLLREVEKYLVLRSRGQHGLPFIQHFAGIVETDLGLGMVVRKVRGPDGRLAPTLAAIVRTRGLSAELVGRVRALRDDVIAHHVVFGDISANNIVETEYAAHGHRLVIIDGLNDRLWLPVNSMSRNFYRIYCDRRFARMMDALGEIDRDRGAAAATVAAPAPQR